MAERFRAAIDGGSRGNPGPAAWGVAILDERGAYREGHAGTLGPATNNVAEYNGLLEALRLAESAGARRVEVFTDSELIVRQIEGAYRVKQPHLKPLHGEALRRIAGFDSFRIRHVPRNENKQADRLVNIALDRAGENGGEPGFRIHETHEPESRDD